LATIHFFPFDIFSSFPDFVETLEFEFR